MILRSHYSGGDFPSMNQSVNQTLNQTRITVESLSLTVPILGSLVVMFKSMDLIDIFDQERPICPNLHIFAGISRQDGLVAVVNVRTRISPTPTHVAPHRDRALLHQLDLFP